MRTEVRLFHVSRDEFRHLEHGDFVLAEDCLQFVIREDVALVLRVLEIVFLDVDPDLLCDFGARERTGANDCLEFRGQSKRFGKCRVRHIDSKYVIGNPADSIPEPPFCL